MDVKVYRCIEAEDGSRLDAYLAAKESGVSRSYWQKLIQAGLVLVNKATIDSVSYKVKVGDQIEILPQPEHSTPVEWDLEIMEETENWVVVNKPAGMLTHAKGALNHEQTVASKLEAQVNQDGSTRAGIVHRLDRDTSGVMIVAKNETALKDLQELFSQRQVHKEYQAIVTGRVRDKSARLTWPIERDPKNPSRFRVGRNGKPAETRLTRIKLVKSATHVRLEPLTGRTHQLRVHMREFGHPILGDRLYSPKVGSELDLRLCLHASQLQFELKGKSYNYKSPMPKIFNSILDDYDK